MRTTDLDQVSTKTSGKMQAESAWRIARPADISWRDWDGLGAVYDDGSGDTHLLDALAIEFLELLSLQPRSTYDLVDALADTVPEAMDKSTAFSFFERQLNALSALDLVERCIKRA